jgi:hypothetical protein
VCVSALPSMKRVPSRALRDPLSALPVLVHTLSLSLSPSLSLSHTHTHTEVDLEELITALQHPLSALPSMRTLSLSLSLSLSHTHTHTQRWTWRNS